MKWFIRLSAIALFIWLMVVAAGTIITTATEAIRINKEVTQRVTNGQSIQP